MADRNAARFFGLIFKRLAESPDERAKEFAQILFDALEESDFDFAPYQMRADEALEKLGLSTED